MITPKYKILMGLGNADVGMMLLLAGVHGNLKIKSYPLRMRGMSFPTSWSIVATAHPKGLWQVDISRILGEYQDIRCKSEGLQNG